MGKVADMVTLEEDPLRMNPDELPAIPVEMVIVGGVYRSFSIRFPVRWFCRYMAMHGNAYAHNLPILSSGFPQRVAI